MAEIQTFASALSSGERPVKVDNIKALYQTMKSQLGGNGWYWGIGAFEDGNIFGLSSDANRTNNIYLNVESGQAYYYDGSKWVEWVKFVLSEGSSTTTPTLPNLSDLRDYSQLEELSKKICAAVDPSIYNYLIGQTMPVSFSGYGTFDCRIVGIKHDGDGKGGFAGMTFMSTKIVGDRAYHDTTIGSKGWEMSNLKEMLNSTLLEAMPSGLQEIIKTVEKPYNYYVDSGGAGQDTIGQSEVKIFVPSAMEVGAKKSDYQDLANGSSLTNVGSTYAYFVEHMTEEDRAMKYQGGNAGDYWIRDLGRVTLSAHYQVRPTVITKLGKFDATQSILRTDIGYIPMFCV